MRRHRSAIAAIEANDFSGSAANGAQERSCEDRTHYQTILSQQSENLLNRAIHKFTRFSDMQVIVGTESVQPRRSMRISTVEGGRQLATQIQENLNENSYWILTMF